MLLLAIEKNPDKITGVQLNWLKKREIQFHSADRKFEPKMFIDRIFLFAQVHPGRGN